MSLGSFRSTIEKLRPQVAPNKNLSDDALDYINELMTYVANRLAPYTPEQLQTNLRSLLPGELGSHALTEMKRKSGPGGKEAIYEYLIAELIELGNNLSRGQDYIDAYAIVSAIQDDEELYELFKNFVPQFPYSIEIDVANKIRYLTPEKYIILPGFVSGVKDYLRAVEGSLHNLNLSQLNQAFTKFGLSAKHHTNPIEAKRQLLDVILSDITNQAIQRLPPGKIQLGFFDVLAVTSNMK